MTQEHYDEESAYEEAAVFFEVEDKGQLEKKRCASHDQLQTYSCAVIAVPRRISLIVKIMGSQNVLESFGKGQLLRTNPTIVGYVVAGVVDVDLLGPFWGKGDTPCFPSTQQAICERSHCCQLSLRSDFRPSGTVSLLSGRC